MTCHVSKLYWGNLDWLRFPTLHQEETKGSKNTKNIRWWSSCLPPPLGSRKFRTYKQALESTYPILSVAVTAYNFIQQYMQRHIVVGLKKSLEPPEQSSAMQLKPT